MLSKVQSFNTDTVIFKTKEFIKASFEYQGSVGGGSIL